MCPGYGRASERDRPPPRQPGLAPFGVLGTLIPSAGAATGPDLAVLSVSFKAPAVAKTGSTVEVADTVRSAGAAAKGSTVACYLSLDARKSRDDLRLTGRRAVGGLKRNGTSKGKKVLPRVPASARVGAYTLLACADDADKVKERSERNNYKAAKGRIVLTGKPRPVAVKPVADDAPAGSSATG